MPLAGDSGAFEANRAVEELFLLTWNVTRELGPVDSLLRILIGGVLERPPAEVEALRGRANVDRPAVSVDGRFE